jgi:hypothetical protein
VIYAQAFFDLQLLFAGKVARLSGLPFARALLEYTNLYIRFGLGRDFDPAHPTWQEYLAGVDATLDAHEWTYRFYTARSGAPTAPAVEATFGCFSYGVLSTDRIRLHFLNTDPDGCSPLGAERRDQRLADLGALFGHVKRTQQEPLQVIGASWLYNLEAYRRLFPPAYVATARVMRGRFQRMPLWGQFLKRDGRVNEALAEQFRARLREAHHLGHIDECFPYQVLSVEAPVQTFDDYFSRAWARSAMRSSASSMPTE